MSRVGFGNFGDALRGAGVKIKITVYYCKGCGQRMVFYPLEYYDGGLHGGFYRCIGCGHKIKADLIDHYAFHTEEEV